MKTLRSHLLGFILVAGNLLGQAAQQAPERELGDFLSIASKDDLREISRDRDHDQTMRLCRMIAEKVEAAEKGKSWTVKFKNSGEQLADGNGVAITSLPEKVIVRIDGAQIPVYFRVRARVPDNKREVFSKLREGRRSFVSGTVEDFSIMGGVHMIGSGRNGITGNKLVVVDIRITADDLGPDK